MTSSTTSIAGIIGGLALNPRAFTEIIGVVKACMFYFTRRVTEDDATGFPKYILFRDWWPLLHPHARFHIHTDEDQTQRELVWAASRRRTLESEYSNLLDCEW